jgi:methionyl-tRNA formyltransferase
MRIGILTNSLPAALPIYEEVRQVAGSEVFVLLLPATNQAHYPSLLRHAARFLLKSGRVRSLQLSWKRAVIPLRKSLQDAETITRLRALQLDVGVHKSGTIYRRETIESFRLGILNAHIGILPKYRGRSVMEWSLMQGDPTGISVFLIDEGIDTGERIVFSETVDVSRCQSLDEAKRYLFDQDARMYRRAIEQLAGTNPEFQINDGSGHRYYVMSKLFQGVAQEVLNRQSAIGNQK